MPKIEVDTGVLLHVLDIGAGDPVVLVPGWSHSADAWDAQIRELAAAGHRVIAVDPRGQGGSDAPYGDYSIARHSADLLAVLDSLNIEQAALVGWSMGGVIVFHTAARRPDRVERLVLVGSNGVGVVSSGEFPHGLPREAAAQFTAGEFTARPQYRRQSIEGAMVAPDPTTVQWLLADSLRTPSWAGIGSLRGLFETNQADDIPAVTAPAMLLHGVADPLFSIEGCRWLTARLKDATLVELPGCGHFPQVEAAERVNDELVKFLGGARR